MISQLHADGSGTQSLWASLDFLAWLLSPVGSKQKTLSTQIQMCTDRTSVSSIHDRHALFLRAVDHSSVLSVTYVLLVLLLYILQAASLFKERLLYRILYRSEIIHRKKKHGRNLWKWGRSFRSWTDKSQHDLELELVFKRSVSHDESVLVCVVHDPKNAFLENFME